MAECNVSGAVVGLGLWESKVVRPFRVICHSASKTLSAKWLERKMKLHSSPHDLKCEKSDHIPMARFDLTVEMNGPRDVREIRHTPQSN